MTPHMKPKFQRMHQPMACMGAVLLQHHDEGWKPVTYASRSISETESQYTQIEKEALVAT